MAKRFDAQGPRNSGTRINQQIVSQSVRLIDQEGAMQGVVPLEDALRQASEASLDLVEVSPSADPPVCKILDYGKYKYETQKRRNEARKRQHTIEVKEVKLRPNIDPHDFEIKMRSVERFLAEGDKVKISLRFRGRELMHQDLGYKRLHAVRERFQEETRVEHEPRLEGRQIIMVLAPK